MTAVTIMDNAPPVWREVLPDHDFLALPSAANPVVVAQDDRQIRSYVRTALLTAPPGRRVPGWLLTAADLALRVPITWWLFPRLDLAGTGPRSEFADFVDALDTRIIVLNHSHDPDTRCVLLLFEAGQKWPALAAKLPSGPDAAGRVRREADRLSAIARLPLGEVRQQVPTVVEMLQHKGFPVLVTTAQPGVPMLVNYHRPGHTADPALVRADLTAAARWLAAMQTATRQPAAPIALPAETIEILRDRLTGADAPILERIAALQERLGRYGVAQTLVHGDFWPGNILVRQGQVCGVVDWEWAQEKGNPVRDLARFALGYSLYLDRHSRAGRSVAGHPRLVAGDFGAGVRYALDGAGWFPRLVRGFLTSGLARLGVPAECGRDAVLAELAAVAAEATDTDFASRNLELFVRLFDAQAG
jgi:hypothetical protein